MVRRSRRLLPFLALVATACGSFDDPASPSHDEADRRRPEPPVAASRVIDAEAPLDVRLLRIEPALHVGSERVCDVLTAGHPQEVTARAAGRYAAPVAARRLVRCGAATGEGWVDLVFPPPTVSFVGAVADGTRLRVKVLAEDGGFEDLPVVEFVAVLGNFTSDPTRYEDFLPLTSGFDFERIAAEDIGEEHRCVVAHVGLPEWLEEPAQARLPGRPTHRMSVVCKHRLGDAWVDLVFAGKEPGAALSLRRGVRASLRIVAARGGRADVPLVSLVGVLPEES